MTPIYKHLLMFALLVAAGWTAASALPTKMLTTAEAQGITYTWTDAAGASHDATLAQTAKDPYQIYAMIREVYSNPAVPGIYYASYEGPNYSSSYYTAFNAGLSDRPGEAYYLTNPDNATRGRDVYYGSIGEGWDITSATKPNEEGYTMLFVALSDGYQDYCTSERLAAAPYFTTRAEVIELIANTIDSVMLVTEGIRANEGTANAGAVFSVKGYFNRFFFMTKGRANDITYGQGHYSTWHSKANPSSSSYPTADEHFGTMPLFNRMFEQYSPNDATIDTQEGYADLTDFYSSMVNGSTYDVKHDCVSVPYQHHGFSMAGVSANTHYTIAGLNIFIPDRRLETWYQQSLTSDGTSWVWSVASDNASSVTTKVLDGRTRWDVALWGATSDSHTYTTSSPYWTYDSETGMYFTYSQDYTGEYPSQNTASTKYYFYNPKHYPKMNLYTVKLQAQAAPATGAGFYTVTLDWTSSFSQLVSDVPQEYWVYVVNADGSLSLLTTTTGVTNYSYEVPMGDPYSYTINYIVKAQPVDSDGNTMFTETWSNEDAVQIPGTSLNEKFRLLLVDNISRYTTVDETNNYENRLRLQNEGITTAALRNGDNKFTFHRVDSVGVDYVFAYLNLNTGGGEALPTIIVSDQAMTMAGSTKSATFYAAGLNLTGNISVSSSDSRFTVSPATLTAINGSVANTAITVTYNGSDILAEADITLTSADANPQTVHVTYSAAEAFTSARVDFTSVTNSMSAIKYYKGNNTVSNGDYGTWAYSADAGPTNGSVYFPVNTGYIRYTLPAAGQVNVSNVKVTITVQDNTYGYGQLIVNGEAKTFTSGNLTQTWTLAAAPGEAITITSQTGSTYYPNQYAPDASYITIENAGTASLKAPRLLATPLTVTPSIKYYNEQGGYTTLNYSSKTYNYADTVDLYGVIDYVNDKFSVPIELNNGHSPYYEYYVTFNEGTGGDTPDPTTPTLSVSPATVEIDGNDGTTGTFTVTGSDLTGNVTITATDGFTVSPATITPTGGAVNQAVTITADGSATTGAVTVTTDGAATQTVNVTYTPASQGGETIIGSLDFSTFSTDTYLSPSSPWGGYFNKQSTYVYIASGNSITFTMPAGYSNATITVAITCADTTDGGSGYFSINGNIVTPTRASTCYYTISNVSSGDTITIKGSTSTGGNRYSPDIDPSSTIYIYEGTVTGN